MVAQLVKNLPAMQKTAVRFLGHEVSLPTPGFFGFSGGSDSKESTCNVRRPGFSPWVGKIPWRRAWEPTPVFLPGESPWTEGGYSPGGCKESDMTERLSTMTMIYQT